MCVVKTFTFQILTKLASGTSRDVVLFLGVFTSTINPHLFLNDKSFVGSIFSDLREKCLGSAKKKVCKEGNISRLLST